MTATATRIRRLARKIELLRRGQGAVSIYHELAKTGDQDLTNLVIIQIERRRGRTPLWAFWDGARVRALDPLAALIANERRPEG